MRMTDSNNQIQTQERERLRVFFLLFFNSKSWTENNKFCVHFIRRNCNGYKTLFSYEYWSLLTSTNVACQHDPGNVLLPLENRIYIFDAGCCQLSCLSRTNELVVCQLKIPLPFQPFFNGCNNVYDEEIREIRLKTFDVFSASKNVNNGPNEISMELQFIKEDDTIRRRKPLAMIG